MRPRSLPPLLLLLLMCSSAASQSVETAPGKDEVAWQKNSLISDLQQLEAKSAKLEKPLAHALANAEIAEAAWALDQDWAKKLLRAAYELTFPEEEQQAELRHRAVGAALAKWTEADEARSIVRNRILAVSGRDRAFADQLARLGARHLGNYEENFRYSKLASEAIKSGDREAAGKFILQAIEADPTLIGFGFSVIELARQDRAAADKLILQYLERLRTFPLSMTNQSATRVHLILKQMVFPSPGLNPQGAPVAPAGRAVVRAYIRYVIESLSRLEEREAGSLKALRETLLSIWVPLNSSAPELAGSFLELEKLSRRPGESASPLPTAGGEETTTVRYEKRIKDALDGRAPDDLTIHFAIGRGDFDAARRLIALLPDGSRKAQFNEQVNTQEAISLASDGHLVEAERLARQLNEAASILRAYPFIVGKCVANKDQPCATSLVYQAIKQLKTAGDSAAIATSLCRLAKAVVPVNDSLALEILDEAVEAANRSGEETAEGRTGLELDVFKILAARSEDRARSAANALKDSLRQIVSLAAIYQWKAEELTKEAARGAQPADTLK